MSIAHRSGRAWRRLHAVAPEILRSAWSAIAASKLRSLLTTLGVIIGVAAVVTMIALGEGAQRAIESRIQALGTDVLTVSPGRHMFRGHAATSQKLVIDDAEAILARAAGVAAVAPELSGGRQLERRNHNAPTTVVATTPAYLEIHRFELDAGRFLNAADLGSRRRVAVFGADALAGLELRPGTILGERVRIGELAFEVIGVLQRKGQQGWHNRDDQVYIPLTTGQLRLFGTDRLRSIAVQVAPGHDPDRVMIEIERVLRRRHRVRPTEDADFTIRNRASLMSTLEDTTRTFKALLAAVAGISLVVGGIGIMNIMLVSVTERTREIGVRMAVGASRRAVLLQFIAEAVIVCILGGLLGVLVGAAATVTVSRVADWNTALTLPSVLLAFSFSVAVGLFFGVVPARRAARLDPIDALRHE